MVDILVKGAYVYTGSELIRDGYVYVRDGTVEAVGSGVPPEEYTFAVMLLGGARRLVLPSLILPVDPIGYFERRPTVCTPSERPACMRKIGRDEQFKLSLPAVMDSHLHGAGRILLRGIDTSVAVKLSLEIGGSYGVIVPEECTFGEHPALEAVVPDTRVEATSCPSRHICLTDNPLEYSEKLARKLGLEPPRIREGVKAHITVLDLGQPPLLGLKIEAPEDAGSAYSHGATVETLLAGEDVLVEVGEHIQIVEKHVKEALRLWERVGR